MWDERYKVDEHVYGTAPNEFLASHAHVIPRGRVLCLAEGEGRNAVFLAQQGYTVTAVDSSSVGLEKARRLSAAQGVELEFIHADLAEFDLGRDNWDGIISIFCHLPPELRRRVHREVPLALKFNGVFLLEAYTPRQSTFATGGPPNVDLMVSADALRDELARLSIEHLGETEREVLEGRGHVGRGAVVQMVATKLRRSFQVSSNRGAARHKVRYVESGGGEDDPTCRLCSAPLEQNNPDDHA